MNVTEIEKGDIIRIIVDRRSKDGNIIPRENSGIHILPPFDDVDLSVGEVWDAEAVSFPGSPAVVVRAKKRISVIADYEPLSGEDGGDDFDYGKYKTVQGREESGCRKAADPDSNPVGSKNDIIGQRKP